MPPERHLILAHILEICTEPTVGREQLTDRGSPSTNRPLFDGTNRPPYLKHLVEAQDGVKAIDSHPESAGHSLVEGSHPILPKEEDAGVGEGENEGNPHLGIGTDDGGVENFVESMEGGFGTLGSIMQGDRGGETRTRRRRVVRVTQREPPGVTGSVVDSGVELDP
jgi:hypothetical protein